MIKQLDKTFVKNCDGLGDHNFTQVKRTPNLAMYRRDNMDGTLHSYEVFIIQTIPAGAKLPGGLVVEQSYERYCTSNTKYAAFCTTLERAEIRYKELLKRVAERGIEATDDNDELMTKVVSKGNRRGRSAVIRSPLVFPKTSKWTMKELVGLNIKEYSQPTAYIELQKFITNKKVKVVGEQKNSGGKGKPAKLYSAV